MFHLGPQYCYNQCCCYGNIVLEKQVFEEEIIITMKINGKNPSLLSTFINLKMANQLKSTHN